MSLAFPEYLKELEPKRITVIPEPVFEDVDCTPTFDEMWEIINCLFLRSCHNLCF